MGGSRRRTGRKGSGACRGFGHLCQRTRNEHCRWLWLQLSTAQMDCHALCIDKTRIPDVFVYWNSINAIFILNPLNNLNYSQINAN